MEFKKYKLNEVLTLNPTLKLKKNTIAKKIAMENIKEYQKKIDSYTYSEFKSGSKFMNGDTLLARITPCLENGKTAYVDILDENEIAFGSTEFFVLRPKDNLMDSHFLYYLMRTNELRNTIIKSMTGTSGRQRAQKESILEYEFCLPSLKIQTAIAKLLKNLDDKIETNKKIIANLEELSQTLFKRWFVDFEFPDENGNPYKSSGGEMVDSELGEIPRSWKVDELGNYIKIKSGKRPKNKVDKKDIENVVPIIGASKIMGYTNDYLYNEKIIIIGRVGTHGVIQRFSTRTWPSDNTFVITSDFESIIYQVLKSIDYISLNRGSTQPLLSQKDIKNTKVVMPTNATLLSKYQKENNHILKMMDQKNIENQKLAQLRDTLLPKLMSGEIEIPDDIEVMEDELSI
ncbi:TPA: restriction endonuclease subunit S [Staphylococcus pseudintermedius]|uniref:restriction endonuclease subunit S n=1 Tax=Staphylococcus pseudintermedius TaxID=283734 RepID=UPI001BDF2977|nr:restriction endonuclease subunit S [Staphylococcus pseudintermedius]HAR6086722.1 restriction endonuclease subunit S [Staphylococcus pseudintermedius]